LRANAIYLDTFGNVKLSALADDLQSALPGLRFGEKVVLRTGEGDGAREIPALWAATFGDVPEGAPLLTSDSYGRVSLAVHQGSAAASYGVELDSVIEVARAPAPTRQARPSQPPLPPAPPRR
jgi:S-adenosylmethionine hydrolase